MTLGNTNGNNQGKKYLKIKGDEVITENNQIEYDHYSYWFTTNYSKIISKVSITTSFSSDVLNETFMNIGNKILYGGLKISDYQSYFSRAYFTNHIQAESKVNNQVSLSVVYDKCDTGNDRLKDVLEMIDVVMAYVEHKYTDSQYIIFHTYFTQFGDKTTFRTLSKDLNVSTFTIHKTIKLILSDIRSNKNLKILYTETK